MPTKPNAPSTVLSDTNIDISWFLPYNGGSPVQSYTITILASDGVSWIEDVSTCDGTNADILSARSCTVPISVLRNPPYLLTYGDSVNAKITATNLVGTSEESESGNGAII